MTDRMGNKIPCSAPYDWLPDALDRWVSAQRGGRNRTDGVRGLLWDGLSWLEQETAKGRYPLRPRALLVVTKSPAVIGAYSLTGEYTAIPSRIESLAKTLTEYERTRFADDVRNIVKSATPVGDQKIVRWSADGDRPGAVITFSVDPDDEAVGAIEKLCAYEDFWTATSVAREILAKGLEAYAPKGWDQELPRAAKGKLFFRTWG